MRKRFTDDEIDEIFLAWPELPVLERWAKSQIKAKAYSLGLRHTPQQLAKLKRLGREKLQQRYEIHDKFRAPVGTREYKAGPKSGKAKIDQAAASAARVF